MNDGGPLVVVPGDVAAAWRGADDPDARTGADDYQRACAAGYPASLLAVGRSVAIVIGAQDHVGVAWWLDALPSALYLVGSVTGADDEDEELTAALHSQDLRAWEPLGQMRSDDGRLLLLHAAWAGDDVSAPRGNDDAVAGDLLGMAVGSSTYAVHATELRLSRRSIYNVIRWTPVAS